MSAIEGGAKVAFVGSTVGSLVTGTGIRLRDAVVNVVEKRHNPIFERNKLKRCVISESTLSQLEDIGFTKKVITRPFTEAKKWAFVTSHGLDIMKDGDTFTGCAPGERIYEVAEGPLLRHLRVEFCRFGGNFHWETQAYRPEEVMDGSGKWLLRKDWGPIPKLELLGNFAKPLYDDWKGEIFQEEQRIPYLLFNSTEGFTEEPPQELLKILNGDHSFVTVLGKEVAMNFWQPIDGTVHWQLISQATPRDNMDANGKPLEGVEFETAAARHGKRVQDSVEAFHPALRQLMALPNKRKVLNSHDVIKIPMERPIFKFEDKIIATPSSAIAQRKMCTLGDSVVPVDAFSWRGDGAALQIEEAVEVMRRMFADSNKYQKGDTAYELREFELDTLKRRFDTATLRDLKDAEMFLNAAPELPVDEHEEEPLAAQLPESSGTSEQQQAQV